MNPFEPDELAERVHSSELVKAALERMGFHPREDVHAFFRLVRFDADGQPCVLVMDGPDMIAESDLSRYLAAAGVDLAEFWNQFDEVRRDNQNRS